MKRFLLLLLALIMASAVEAAPGPIRILYLGKEGTSASKHCHVLMREFGRDAI